MTVAGVMAKYLSEIGVKYAFGYPGDPNIGLVEACRREGMECILGTREGSIGFMAEAAGMLTNIPGLAISTLGPGCTALVNPVATANQDRVPMIAISGQITSKMEQYFTHQVVDHNRLFSPITKWTARVTPNAVSTIMRKAIRTAMADRPGVVHLTTTADIVEAPAQEVDITIPPLNPVPSTQVFASEPGADPMKMINKAKKPVILTGISAHRADATESLKAMSEKLGIPVVVAPMSKGVFPEDHPYFASVVDMACNKIVWDYLKSCDLLLCVGFDPVELIKPWSVDVPAIHIDSTPNTDQIYKAEVEIVGHIPTILDAITAAYSGPAKVSEAAVKKHRAELVKGFYEGRKKGVLNPSDVIDAINGSYAGSDAIVSTDVGSHKLLVGQGWQATKPHSFLMTNGLSSMGFSVPAAIAAKTIYKDRPVVCTVGDGGFAMAQGELQFAADRGLGMVVVVFCDNSLNRIEIKQMLKQYPSELTRIGSTDMVKLAEAMSCHGAFADNSKELERLLDDAKTNHLDRPLVIGAKIDPDQYVKQF